MDQQLSKVAENFQQNRQEHPPEANESGKTQIVASGDLKMDVTINQQTMVKPLEEQEHSAQQMVTNQEIQQNEQEEVNNSGSANSPDQQAEGKVDSQQKPQEKNNQNQQQKLNIFEQGNQQQQISQSKQKQEQQISEPKQKQEQELCEDGILVKKQSLEEEQISEIENPSKGETQTFQLAKLVSEGIPSESIEQNDQIDYSQKAKNLAKQIRQKIKAKPYQILNSSKKPQQRLTPKPKRLQPLPQKESFAVKSSNYQKSQLQNKKITRNGLTQQIKVQLKLDPLQHHYPITQFRNSIMKEEENIKMEKMKKEEKKEQYSSQMKSFMEHSRYNRYGLGSLGDSRKYEEDLSPLTRQKISYIPTHRISTNILYGSRMVANKQPQEKTLFLINNPTPDQRQEHASNPQNEETRSKKIEYQHEQWQMSPNEQELLAHANEGKKMTVSNQFNDLNQLIEQVENNSDMFL